MASLLADGILGMTQVFIPMNQSVITQTCGQIYKSIGRVTMRFRTDRVPPLPCTLLVHEITVK